MTKNKRKIVTHFTNWKGWSNQRMFKIKVKEILKKYG